VPNVWLDSSHTFTQEVRLVSATGPDRRSITSLGLFYQNQHSGGSWTVSERECRSAPRLRMHRAYYIGATFPNCLVRPAPATSTSISPILDFQDKSEFGADLAC